MKKRTAFGPLGRNFHQSTKLQFLAAVDEMVDDLRAQRPFRKGLRIKKFQSMPGVFEMTWAKNGRALFRYGNPIIPGEKHIIWIRVGTHDIFEKQ